jgi:hypothetical protein
MGAPPAEEVPMFTHAWKLGLSLALAGVALAGASFAFASGGSTASAMPQTFRVFDHTVRSHNVDVDNSHSFTIGDEFIFTDRLWNADRTERIGKLHGVCTVVSHTTAHCLETAHLRGSTLEGAGDISGDAARFRQAITGGTGRFIGATGEFRIHQLNENDSLVTIVITG